MEVLFSMPQRQKKKIISQPTYVHTSIHREEMCAIIKGIKVRTYFRNILWANKIWVLFLIINLYYIHFVLMNNFNVIWVIFMLNFHYNSICSSYVNVSKETFSFSELYFFFFATLKFHWNSYIIHVKFCAGMLNLSIYVSL